MILINIIDLSKHYSSKKTRCAAVLSIWAASLSLVPLETKARSGRSMLRKDRRMPVGQWWPNVSEGVQKHLYICCDAVGKICAAQAAHIWAAATAAVVRAGVKVVLWSGFQFWKLNHILFDPTVRDWRIRSPTHTSNCSPWTGLSANYSHRGYLNVTHIPRPPEWTFWESKLDWPKRLRTWALIFRN